MPLSGVRLPRLALHISISTMPPIAVTPIASSVMLSGGAVSPCARLLLARASITAEGEIYNLSSPADLTGNFSAVTAGLTAVVGGSVAYLRNEKGVVIKLHSQTEGLRFNLSANGVRLTLKQS